MGLAFLAAEAQAAMEWNVSLWGKHRAFTAVQYYQQARALENPWLISKESEFGDPAVSWVS